MKNKKFVEYKKALYITSFNDSKEVYNITGNKEDENIINQD